MLGCSSAHKAFGSFWLSHSNSLGSFLVFIWLCMSFWSWRFYGSMHIRFSKQLSKNECFTFKSRKNANKTAPLATIPTKKLMVIQIPEATKKCTSKSGCAAFSHISRSHSLLVKFRYGGNLSTWLTNIFLETTKGLRVFYATVERNALYTLVLMLCSWLCASPWPPFLTDSFWADSRDPRGS